jgi:hypothetical protein
MPGKIVNRRTTGSRVTSVANGSSEDVVAIEEALQMRPRFWDSIVCPGVTV